MRAGPPRIASHRGRYLPACRHPLQEVTTNEPILRKRERPAKEQKADNPSDRRIKYGGNIEYLAFRINRVRLDIAARIFMKNTAPHRKMLLQNHYLVEEPSNMTNYIVVSVALWIVCGGTCAVIAAGKGRNPAGWFLLGLLFSLFALVAVCALPNIKTSTGKVSLSLDSRDNGSIDNGNIRVEPEPVWRTAQSPMTYGKYGKSWNSTASKFYSQQIAP
jgi:hypothetical protein